MRKKIEDPNPKLAPLAPFTLVGNLISLHPSLSIDAQNLIQIAEATPRFSSRTHYCTDVAPKHIVKARGPAASLARPAFIGLVARGRRRGRGGEVEGWVGVGVRGDKGERV